MYKYFYEQHAYILVTLDKTKLNKINIYNFVHLKGKNKGCNPYVLLINRYALY
jgi:hypothetical protein